MASIDNAEEQAQQHRTTCVILAGGLYFFLPFPAPPLLSCGMRAFTGLIPENYIFFGECLLQSVRWSETMS